MSAQIESICMLRSYKCFKFQHSHACPKIGIINALFDSGARNTTWSLNLNDARFVSICKSRRHAVLWKRDMSRGSQGSSMLKISGHRHDYLPSVVQHGMGKLNFNSSLYSSPPVLYPDFVPESDMRNIY